MKPSTLPSAGLSDAAMHAATGRAWAEWRTVLDQAGAKSWSHAEIAQWLHKKHRIAEWWCQMVAVGYERTTGRRVKHQKTTGFEVSVSRTFAAPVDRAFEAWKDAAQRARWLPGAVLTVRKATPHKSIRIEWHDGTKLSVNFWPKGPLKCQVVPQHGQLPDAATAERMKAYWSERLDALRVWLEGA